MKRGPETLPSTRHDRPRRKRKARRPVRLAAFLAILAGCLSDEINFETDSAEHSLESAGAEESALADVPPGEIIDTLPNSGWTEGAFSVNHDGAAEYHLPLWVPDARRSLAPNLALHYDSRNGNGLLGVGWTLQGLSSVTPCRRTLAEDGRIANPSLSSSHRDDAYCLDGERLRPTDNEWSPEQDHRVERDTFARIRAHSAPWPQGALPPQPDYFKVWTKAGTILTLGGAANAKLLAYTLQGIDPEEPGFQRSGARVTAAWALSKIEERNGNAITIAYERIETQADRWSVEFRPKEITYAPNRKIEFVYEQRTDSIDRFVPGTHGAVHIRLGNRLKAIRMLAGTTLLREYRLAYEDDSITARSRLTSVIECDGGAPAVCLNALEFDWSGPTGYSYQAIDTNVTDVGTSPSSGFRYTVADINGDGADDLLYGNATNEWRMRFSNRTSGFSSAVSAGIPHPFPSDPGYKPKFRTIDYNRDGRTDLLTEVPAPGGFSKFALYKSMGNSYAPAPSPIDDEAIDTVFGVYAAFFADVDGNGLPDYLAPFIQDVDGDGSRLRWRYRLNLENGFGPLVQTDLYTAGPGPDPGGGFDRTYQVRATSLEGNRAQLLLWNKPLGQYNALQLPEGTFAPTEVLNLPFNRLPENKDRRGLHFADVNGDGLEDAIYPCNGLSTQLNSGSGFSDLIPGPADYADPPPPSLSYDLSVRVADFNGDGADDVMILHPGKPINLADYSQGFQLYVWRNDHFVRVIQTGLINQAAFPGSVSQRVQPLDFDGDGLMDIGQIAAGSPQFLRILRRNGDLPDKLVRVKVAGLGTRVEAEYRTLADRGYHTPGTCAYPLMCPVRGGSMVSRHWLANGVDDGVNQFAHHYTAARVDLLGRGWLGFEDHSVLDYERLGALTTTYFDNTTREDIGVVSTSGGHATVYPFAGGAKQIVYTVAQGPFGLGWNYKRTVTLDDDFRLGAVPGTYVVERGSETDVDAERPDGGVWGTLHTRTTVFNERDDFGNATRITTEVPGSDQVDVLSHDNDEVSWLIGKLKTRTVTSCTRPDNDCRTRESSFDHDANGNLTEAVVEPDDDEFRLRTVIAYGTLGRIDSITTSDAAGEQRTASLTYDSLNLYAKKVTNALGHTAEVTVDAGLGVALERRDANGVPTTMKYDRFGKLREINYANGYFERQATWGPQAYITTVPDGQGGTVASESMVLDKLGRVLDGTALAFDGSYSVTRRSYDTLGRLAEMSRPFPSGSGETIHYTTYAYDTRDRLVLLEEPDGVATSHEYIGRDTHTYDGKGNHTYVVERGDGGIGSSYEDDPKAASWLKSGFEYGPFGLLKKMTSPDGTSQTMAYDKLGRRTGLVDPSAGSTTADYNPFGELVEEIDGAGRKTTIEYDVLGRPKVIQFPEGKTTNTWDTATNGIGKLQQAKSPDGVVTRYQYDPVGRNKITIWDIEGASYQVDLGYDGIGRLDTVTYPKPPGADRLKVQYRYTGTGYLSRVEDALGSARYWRAEERNAAGQLELESYGGVADGDGVVRRTSTYNPKTGLLIALRVDGPSGRLDNLVFTYDDNRNLIGRSDSVGDPMKVQEYTYDSLNRLVTWTFKNLNQSDPVTTAYDYDKVGNLNSETVTGKSGWNVTYKYGENGAPPHRLTSRNGSPYTYDAAGRQLTGPNRTIAYNSLNLPTLLTRTSGQTTQFAYDASGARVVKRDSGETTISVAGIFERRSANDFRNVHYILADGRAVAQVTRVQATASGPVTATDLSYLHDDSQGSTIQTTSASGAVIEELFYDPFGRRTDKNYTPLIPQRRALRLGYTGHEHDDEIDLINMKGRVYDPSARRFLTPDPFIQAPLFSLSHNRYSYVWNNPATFIDPTGFCPSAADPKDCMDEQQDGFEGQQTGCGVGGCDNLSVVGYPEGGSKPPGDGTGSGSGGGTGGRSPHVDDSNVTNPVGSGGESNWVETNGVGSWGNGCVYSDCSDQTHSFYTSSFDRDVYEYLAGSPILRGFGIRGDVDWARYEELANRAVADPEFRASVRRSNALMRPDSFDNELSAMGSLMGGGPRAARGPVLFGQRRISPRFSEEGLFKGRTITSVARDLKAGVLSPDDVPIQAFVGPGGQLIAVNNRSLAALSLAGMTPTRITIIEPTRALLRRLSEPSTLPIAPVPGRTTVVTGGAGNEILGTVSVP